MFENLSEKLQRVFKNLRGQGKLTPENMEQALKEIRVALLEADVHFRVVKQFIEDVKQKAMGEDVLTALSPEQQVIKIVHDEMIRVLGSHQSRLRFANDPPTIILVVGLQGSGKTTSTGKLARWLSRNGHSPLMVSVDIYRPAARHQLSVIARDVGLPVYEGLETEKRPSELARGARREAGQTGRDVVLVDTAGRLHIDEDLMTELQELKQQLEPTEILFVADAMTGQDAVKSAEEFHKRLGITGVILTKMDGDARGGAALSIRHVTGQAAEVRGRGREVRRVGAVPSGPRGVAHSGHGRRAVLHREGGGGRRGEEGRGDCSRRSWTTISRSRISAISCGSSGSWDRSSRSAVDAAAASVRSRT